MPIDLKEFERVINDHFKNATEEEMIQTLRKASPHLFEDITEEHCEDSVSVLSEVTPMQQLPKIQFSEEWLKTNATAELVENAYNCLPQTEKEKFLATIFANSSQMLPNR